VPLNPVPLCPRERHSSAFDHASQIKLNGVLFRQFVDLGGEDKIVFAQPTNRMRPKLNRHEAVTLQMEVGMVSVFLGDNGHILEEGEPLEEVLHLPVLADSRVVVGQKPAGEIAQLAMREIERTGVNATFARLALLLTQLLNCLDFQVPRPSISIDLGLASGYAIAIQDRVASRIGKGLP